MEYQLKPYDPSKLLLHTEVLLLAFTPDTTTLEYAAAMYAVPRLANLPDAFTEQFFGLLHVNDLNILKVDENIDELVFALALREDAQVRTLGPLADLVNMFPQELTLTNVIGEDIVVEYHCKLLTVPKAAFVERYLFARSAD